MDINLKFEKLREKLKKNKFNEVINECNKLIKKFPKADFIYNLCGLAYQKSNRLNESVEYFNKALNLTPDDLGFKNNIALSYKELDEVKKADQIFTEILKERKNYLPALVNYASLKRKVKDFTKTIDLYKQAVELSKNDLNLLSALASAYQSNGLFEDAKKICNKILKVNPNHVMSHKLISEISNYSLNQSNLNEMISLYKNKNLNNINEKADLAFSIAKAYDDKKNYEKSFSFYKDANKLKSSIFNYDLLHEAKLFNNIIKVFENFSNKLKHKTFNNKKIIFICGLPRSGTTLLEQIISAHKEVIGAGELDFLRKVLKKKLIKDHKISINEIINEIDKNTNIINEEYFRLLDNLNLNASVVIDKAPQNFIWVGFIKIFFPNCKIIHCNRDPKDNFLSLYKNNFGSNDMNWSYDPKDIVIYMNLYFKLMNFWNKSFKDFIYDANYETIVQNSEEEIKKLLQFCELDWDSNCLQHHKSKKTSIQTVSIYQARRPIYTSSINSSKIYSSELEKYFSQLNLGS